MSPREWAAFLILFAALFSYLNHLLLRLPGAVGLTVLALAGPQLHGRSGALPNVDLPIKKPIAGIDLNRAFLRSTLVFMLFVGAMHVNLADRPC